MKIYISLIVALLFVNRSGATGNDVRTKLCEITAVGHIHEGFVNPDAPFGSRIKVTQAEDKAIAGGEKVEFLQMNIVQCDKSHGNYRFVADTPEFSIDDEYYVIVNDSINFETEDRARDFSIHLERLTDHKRISNPFSFTVRLEEIKPDPEKEEPYVPGAAIFAGVLILFIVVMALAIPLVVRAKRRYSQGKPMFKPGSHPSTNDLVDLQKQNGLKSIESREPNWYGNAQLTYEEEVEQEKKQFGRDLVLITKNSIKRQNERDSIKKDTKQISTISVNAGNSKNGTCIRNGTDSVPTINGTTGESKF